MAEAGEILFLSGYNPWMEETPSAPMRTDECARRIEYVTHGKWTPDQYKAVCSIIRLYRHEAIIGILDRAAGGADDSGGKVIGK